ncbi:MAG: alanine racemase [Paludibacter sp.]|nr:alanine racemase [Bacteroidales bacterium]MCM1069461.1 alanine racemase [Prevotella sp.]MCM1353835.1 alanine racemase [Bacteroides sp.]MCM1442765.1 alanine racemase [Muribaculum sp.]MCM1481871.1 alanine racemase [Paludibacter sp.]
MKLSEIASIIAPDTRIVKDRNIVHLLTDSRELHTEPSETLFFALRTPKNDGARYVADLYAKGVRAFVVCQCSACDVSAFPEAEILQTEDSLYALQALAAYKRSLYSCPVIGITGSNGKTVVKEWLYQLLKDDYKITRSPKSYNSQIGVPLSVWQMNEETELAIFEAGISQPGEMELLERIIRPTIGVVTYIGEEHGENFRSIEEKREEKMKLFARCEIVIEEPTHQNVRTCAAVLRQLGYAEDCISEMLMQKTHETVLEINLDALTHNVRCFRSRLRKDTRLMCMVKAFAYGAGAIEVSRSLQQNGLADYLAVAVCDEAVELRRAGITLPIVIMDPEPAALKKIIENNLEPNVYSFESLENIISAVESEGLEHYPIHIKIDSGMHRLGFEYADMQQLTERLRHQHAVCVKSVFSHLAGADEPQFDTFTHAQIDLFNRCADFLKAALDTAEHLILKHILNSAGIERFTDYQYDMCRLGIGIYGFSAAHDSRLRNVCTLRTTLLSVKTVKAGESIGYGLHTTLGEDRQVAVIPIGYADGFDRRFSNYGGEVLVRGKRCPVLGNVCMDLAMIDVSDTDALPGDAAIIFGDELPIEELARKLGTITYEILTSVSRRVKRVYISE